MAQEFVQLPPDGAGKRIRHLKHTDLSLATNGAVLPDIGDFVYGAISNATGQVEGIRTVDETVLYLRDVTGTFTINEQVRNQSGSLVYGTVQVSIPDMYSPALHIADPRTPANMQRVDERGAARVTFTEGTPQFDAYGGMQVSQKIATGSYYHIGYDRPEKYWTKQVGGGTVSHEAQSSSALYQVGVNPGDEARRTTNLYHPYKPGVSQLIMTTVICGDGGKSGLIREWGYFDDLNGFGFRQNNGVLQVFLRSDAVTGTPSEIVVNQEDWSDNTLDDPITSDFVLNEAKGNTYWMDMEWFGVGRVRLGVYAPDGRRILCHSFENANANEWPFMRTGSLPMTWIMRNTGVTGSVSQMRVTGAAVYAETGDVEFPGRLLHYSPPSNISISAADGYKPVISFRAKLELSGFPNRVLGIHETFDWAVIGDSPVHIAIFVHNQELPGTVWREDIVPGTVSQIDVTATSMPQNIPIVESFIAGGNSASRSDLGDRIEKAFMLNADGVTRNVITFAVKVLKPNTTVDFFFTKFWKEIR